MKGSSSPFVILDSDFLSSFLKIDRLDLVRAFYQVTHLLIPPAVFREVSQTRLLERLAETPWLEVAAPGSQILTRVSPQIGAHELGAGELEAIALALEHPNSLLLTSDNRARREATRSGAQVVNIPAFLLACKVSGFLDRAQIAAIVRDLEEKDRYGFRQEVLARLLAEP